MSRTDASEQDVIVVGGGLAGMSAALTLAGQGRRVTLLERRPYMGGRAYSYLHPALEEVVDSQHVLLGCCTNLLSFCSEVGIADKVRWYDRQTFLEPAAEAAAGPTQPRASDIARSALPTPLHYGGSFLRARMLSATDKLAMARGLREFARGNTGRDDESAADWYRRTGQTERSIRHFWEPILLATLNDEAKHCSMKYAGKVFYELFLKNADGGRLGIPTVPLSDFYQAGADALVRLGGRVELRAGVERLAEQLDGSWEVSTAAAGDRPEQTYRAGKVVLALPFEQTRRLIDGMALRTGEPARAELQDRLARFVHSPFISVLLWFDRQITELDHAWLLDTTIQWFFNKSVIRAPAGPKGRGAASYVEVIIAGSKRELTMSREQILGPALKELARFFPEVRNARLVKSGILKEARATFSVTPGLDRYRPAQATAWPGLFLAGDWTRTDWPSTMEGAVRSGRLAAGAAMGEPGRFLARELPAEGVMGWIGRD